MVANKLLRLIKAHKIWINIFEAGEDQKMSSVFFKIEKCRFENVDYFKIYLTAHEKLDQFEDEKKQGQSLDQEEEEVIWSSNEIAGGGKLKNQRKLKEEEKEIVKMHTGQSEDELSIGADEMIDELFKALHPIYSTAYPVLEANWKTLIDDIFNQVINYHFLNDKGTTDMSSQIIFNREDQSHKNATSFTDINNLIKLNPTLEKLMKKKASSTKSEKDQPLMNTEPKEATNKGSTQHREQQAVGNDQKAVLKVRLDLSPDEDGQSNHMEISSQEEEGVELDKLKSKNNKARLGSF